MSASIDKYESIMEKNEDVINNLHLDWFRKTYINKAVVECVGDGQLFDFTNVLMNDIKLSLVTKTAVVCRAPVVSSGSIELCYLRLNGVTARYFVNTKSSALTSAKADKQALAKATAKAKAKQKRDDAERKEILEKADRQPSHLLWPVIDGNFIGSVLSKTEFNNSKQNSSTGFKETEGKLPYELSFEFIKAMAERMQSNKGKYEPYNWKKPISKDDLIGAIKRHGMEIFIGNFEDNGDPLGGITALACDLMMFWHQLKNYPETKLDFPTRSIRN